jgi:hypothetical protein
MNGYQIFFVESYMDSLLSLQMEGPRFSNLNDANAFYKNGNYALKGKGSTEDHEEYKVLEIRDRKIFLPGSSIPLKRTAVKKSGDFIVAVDASNVESICVITDNGEELLTWRDR